MAIWRVTVKRVEAWREDKLPEQVKVEVKPKIVKADIETAGNAKLARVDYELEARYEPGAGKISVSGSMYIVGEKAENIIKDGKITDIETLRQVYQRIFLEPMVIAIEMAKELLLPLPVKMPEVKIEQKKKA